MATGGKKTKAQLAATYPDNAWREKFLRLLNVSSLLRNSIVAKSYKIPDDLNTSIYLTERGQEISGTLKAKHDVPYKEAKLMCFLVMVYQEALVDIEKTNYPVLVEEIGKQLKSGEIRLPFIFGRTLYDRAADLFKDQRSYLTVADTQKLLDGTRNGVFQLGEMVTGPYGIIKSQNERTIVPLTNIPLQHCPDLSCENIHYVQLTTDYEAPINAHRPKLARLLEQGNKEPSDWNGFIEDLAKSERDISRPDDLNSESLLYLLGDGLADRELRVLFERLLDSTGSTLRASAAEVGLRGSAEEISAGLDRAQMMQLMLVLADSQILHALDHCVLENKIEVPVGEVRRAQVTADERYGTWGLQPELGSNGARFVSPNRVTLPMLRLTRLINGLYDPDKLEDMQNLDWSLRRIDAVTAGAKLAEYLRSAAPEDVVRNLVLARRENADYAAEKLGLPDLSNVTDDAIVSSILWKLGFNSAHSESPHARFFRRQEEVSRLATEARRSSTVDEEPIRRAAAVFFEDLEFLLVDSLAYATWGLLEDHYANERPFVFSPTQDTKPALDKLSVASIAQSTDPKNAVSFDEGRATLQPLIRGFGILAEMLDALRVDAHLHLRPKNRFPAYLARTDLKQFPFVHVVPFLDIQAPAQVEIITNLREIRRDLSRQNVSEIRNDLIHFRRTTVDIDRVSAGLDAVSTAVRYIQTLGFLRIPYARAATRTDEWGRSAITLVSADGQPVTFTRPSAYDWLPLPPLSAEQFLMHAAVYAEPNEVLRFSPGSDSPYQEMWTNYPRRTSVRDNSVAKQSEPAAVGVDSTGRSSTRAG